MVAGRAPKICLVPQVHGVGGMVSFQHKFVEGLHARGVRTSGDIFEPGVDAVLVIGGTRRFTGLRQARQRGIPVVQRLDGMNWLHRLEPLGRRLITNLRHTLRAEYGNLVLQLIRTRLATHVVYQSEFVRGWWEKSRGKTHVPHSIIYNGVDLSRYTPQGPEKLPDDCRRILMVEGSLMGGYEGGLRVAVELAGRLAGRLQDRDRRSRLQEADRWAGEQDRDEPSRRQAGDNRPVELGVAGRAPEALKTGCEAALREKAPEARIAWVGVAPAEDIPALDRSAHLLYSADINAACPNAAIEALACGLPVLGFATGALPELVRGDAGRLADYGGDPWKLDSPDIDGLAAAALELLYGGERFRRAARAHAEAEFGLDRMVDRYLELLLGKAA